MSSQDEREWAKRFVRAVFRDEAAAVQWTANDEADLDECIATVGPYPRPTSDAAAVVAAIVADLRARATSEREGADSIRANASSNESPVMRIEATARYASAVLAEAADRIEAAHPRPASGAAASLSGLDHNALRRMDKESLRTEIERLRCLLHGRSQTVAFGPSAPADDPRAGRLADQYRARVRAEALREAADAANEPTEAATAYEARRRLVDRLRALADAAERGQ